MRNWLRRRRTSSRRQYDDPQPPPPQDPIAADRKRREYESLFASNVVLSRRPENERPDVGRNTSQSNAPGRADGASPSVDEVADAVVRATTRTAGLTSNSASQILQQAPTPLAAITAFVGVAPSSRPNATD